MVDPVRLLLLISQPRLNPISCHILQIRLKLLPIQRELFLMGAPRIRPAHVVLEDRLKQPEAIAVYIDHLAGVGLEEGAGITVGVAGVGHQLDRFALYTGHERGADEADCLLVCHEGTVWTLTEVFA